MGSCLLILHGAPCYEKAVGIEARLCFLSSTFEQVSKFLVMFEMSALVSDYEYANFP